MHTAWEWWTAVIIPAAGVLASTAVAVAAVVVTVRLATAQRAETERSRRLEYALAVDLALAEYRSKLESGQIDYQEVESVEAALQEVTVKMDAAAVPLQDMSAVDAWLTTELQASLGSIWADARDGHRTGELQKLRQRVVPRLMAWARTGTLEAPPSRPTDDALRITRPDGDRYKPA